jgi:hypothetical protein
MAQDGQNSVKTVALGCEAPERRFSGTSLFVQSLQVKFGKAIINALFEH